MEQTKLVRENIPQAEAGRVSPKAKSKAEGKEPFSALGKKDSGFRGQVWFA